MNRLTRPGRDAFHRVPIFPKRVWDAVELVPTNPWFVALWVLAMTTCFLQAAESRNAADKEKERQLIAVLKSDAPPQEKAVPCKQLAIYGTREAVPALAVLLSDPRLASWARIALEAIPDPAADAALRAAMGKVQGYLLVGVINSIGNRRDPKAVSGLIKKLNDNNTEVASAAAIALGRVGGDKASRALARALPGAHESVRGAVAEGSILCAEKLLAQGKRTDAVKIYDLIRSADVPKQRVLEATRGAILARGPEGLPLLLEQLRSPDKAMLAIGLHTARELPGREVTEALAAEIRKANADRQTYLLLAISSRSDSAVLPAVLEAAKSGSPKLKLAAVGVLDKMGNVSSLPVLLEAATSGDKEVSQAAVSALARLPGEQVDSTLMNQLPQSSGATRQVLIQLAAQRRIEAAIPAIVQSTQDTDAGIRTAAIQAVGVLGTEKQAGDLAGLLTKAKDSKERDEVEMALIGLAGRTGAASASGLQPLMKSTDPAVRMVGLHALASAGGPDALTTVKSAIEDSDESVQDEAVRTLSTWPNNWPEDAAVAEPLLTLAKTGKKMSHQVLGLRGYLEYVKGDKRLKDEEKAAKVNELLPLMKRPEEKRLAIAAIDKIPTSAVLQLLVDFAGEPAIADDACSAILSVSGKGVTAVPKEERQKALQAVVEKTTNNDTRKKAEEMLKKTL